ncbi:MAG: RNA polymerase factor sigma-54 [Bdellovibrio sp.]|nr:RNA polymerase factor sigma-54 [Bdellovibrio sp.]
MAALEIKQSLKLSQQLVMTPQLQQAIKLLQLNRMELQEVINQELTENPALEEIGEESETETPQGEGSAPSDTETRQDPEGEQKRDEEAFLKPIPKEEKLALNSDETFNWESYVEEFDSSHAPSLPSMREINEELPSFENALTKTTSLEEHLNWQLSMTTLTDAEKKLGELIIGNLTEDGYLNVTLEELAQETEVNIEDAEEILKIIHNFDPIGSASRNLKECLLVQAKFLSPAQPLIEKMVENHLNDLEKKNYQTIARALNVPISDIIDATKVILEFEPKPGRSFHTGDTYYITPDIYVYKIGEEFAIVLNEDGLPRLKISPYYKRILTTAKQDKNNVTKEYVQEKLRSAVWLIRSIHNRQKTIYKVTEAIVRRQKEFFIKGIQSLKPMVLRDVANDIGMHESTISRVTTNKFVHTPVGIYELKYFFNSSVNTTPGTDAIASEAVKEYIRHMVLEEDTKNPLSDQRIVEILQSKNIEIARRTVAKYRDVLGILSSGKRKKVL